LIEQRCSAESLYPRADDFGLRTSKGKTLSRSKFYALFRNPFYHGQFSWNKTLYPGKHEPMISKAQFDVVQRLLDGRGPDCSTRHVFAFTRLIRCGECGASITAE
jgi:site-specific DNA recombinase